MNKPALFPHAFRHFSGPHVPVGLLRLFMFSLLLCILVIAGFEVQGALTQTLSNYRRQMNAAAFNAQQFFGQRESLLKAISSSAVRTNEGTPSSKTLNFLATHNQLRIFALSDNDAHARWALILTARDLVEIASTHSELVYLAPNQGLIRSLYQPGAGVGAQLGANTDWLRSLDQDAAQALLQQHPDARTLWSWMPNGTAKQVYLLRPIDEHNAADGWLGLQLEDTDLALDPLQLHQGKYVLYDANGAVVLHSSAWAVPKALSCFKAAEDSFGLHRLRGLPDYIVLNKSVGNAGWRLVYYAPVSQLLQDTSGPLYRTALVTLLLFAGIFLGSRYIRLRLVEPAVRHYSALADSVSLNHRFIEMAPVGLCLIRRDEGSLILSNASGRRWLAAMPELQGSILSSAHSHVHSIEHGLADGTFIQLICAPTSYDNVPAVLCCMSDVTGFKRAEHSLRQAKSLADQANREKTQFLSTLSHEIRTPMYGILGSLEMLNSTPLSPQQQDYLAASQQASSALMRTINDTLDLSLIEAGRLSLNNVAFSPVHLVEEVAFSYSARARGKGLRLYVTLDPDTPPWVIGDGGRIRQILNNLVSNAIKFTESGHVILRLHCVPVDGEAPLLRLQVVDTGPGIAAEFQSNLFEPYYQVPNWLSQDAGGSGLGLAICARLADMMHGHLSATSEPGLGSSFGLSLALEPCAASTQTEWPRLDVTPVYVRGDVLEVVHNLCHWLRRWGALAMPYSPDKNVAPHHSVLVEAFVDGFKPGTWAGPRVIMHAPGMGPAIRQANAGWVAQMFSLDSLRNAVAQAQAGVISEIRFSPPNNLAPRMDLKLLAVDDSPLALQVLRQQAEHLGNQVVASARADSILKRSDLLSFDAVLTDLQMQPIDGLSFARALRERGFDGPIIGITGELSPSLRGRCESAGIRHLLIKPVPLDTLCEVLQSIKRKVM